jgi:hypothetical protein
MPATIEDAHTTHLPLTESIPDRRRRWLVGPL